MKSRWFRLAVKPLSLSLCDRISVSLVEVRLESGESGVNSFLSSIRLVDRSSNENRSPMAVAKVEPGWTWFSMKSCWFFLFARSTWRVDATNFEESPELWSQKFFLMIISICFRCRSLFLIHVDRIVSVRSENASENFDLCRWSTFLSVRRGKREMNEFYRTFFFSNELEFSSGALNEKKKQAHWTNFISLVVFQRKRQSPYERRKRNFSWSLRYRNLEHGTAKFEHCYPRLLHRLSHRVEVKKSKKFHSARCTSIFSQGSRRTTAIRKKMIRFASFVVIPISRRWEIIWSPSILGSSFQCCPKKRFERARRDRKSFENEKTVGFVSSSSRSLTPGRNLTKIGRASKSSNDAEFSFKWNATKIVWSFDSEMNISLPEISVGSLRQSEFVKRQRRANVSAAERRMEKHCRNKSCSQQSRTKREIKQSECFRSSFRVNLWFRRSNSIECNTKEQKTGQSTRLALNSLTERFLCFLSTRRFLDALEYANELNNSIQTFLKIRAVRSSFFAVLSESFRFLSFRSVWPIGHSFSIKATINSVVCSANGVLAKRNSAMLFNVRDIFSTGFSFFLNEFFSERETFLWKSFSGMIEEFLHEEDALMDFLKRQSSYCDVIKCDRPIETSTRNVCLCRSKERCRETRAADRKQQQTRSESRRQTKSARRFRKTRISTVETQKNLIFLFEANGKLNFSVYSFKSKLFGENEETRYAKIETMDSDINDAVLHCQNSEIRIKFAERNLSFRTKSFFSFSVNSTKTRCSNSNFTRKWKTNKSVKSSVLSVFFRLESPDRFDFLARRKRFRDVFLFFRHRRFGWTFAKVSPTSKTIFNRTIFSFLLVETNWNFSFFFSDAKTFLWTKQINATNFLSIYFSFHVSSNFGQERQIGVRSRNLDENFPHSNRLVEVFLFSFFFVFGRQISSSRYARRPSAGHFSIDQFVESIKARKFKRIVVLAGAGISTPSGIPDFRFDHFLCSRSFPWRRVQCSVPSNLGFQSVSENVLCGWSPDRVQRLLQVWQNWASLIRQILPEFISSNRKEKRPLSTF